MFIWLGSIFSDSLYVEVDMAGFYVQSFFVGLNNYHKVGKTCGSARKSIYESSWACGSVFLPVQKCHQHMKPTVKTGTMMCCQLQLNFGIFFPEAMSRHTKLEFHHCSSQDPKSSQYMSLSKITEGTKSKEATQATNQTYANSMQIQHLGQDQEQFLLWWMISFYCASSKFTSGYTGVCGW